MIAFPLARAGATRAYLQTDLSLHYPACLLPPALAHEDETRLPLRFRPSLSYTDIGVSTDPTSTAASLCTTSMAVFESVYAPTLYFIARIKKNKVWTKNKKRERNKGKKKKGEAGRIKEE